MDAGQPRDRDRPRRCGRRRPRRGVEEVGAASRSLVVGWALLALPLVLVGWAMARHARPVDHQSTTPLLIAFVPSESKKTPFVGSYRGVRVGDRVSSLLARLGTPDRREVTDGDIAYWYGNDAFHAWAARGERIHAITVRDTRAETAEGVGIGDNLAVAKRHTPYCDYYDNGFDVFRPSCDWSYPFQVIRFEGDPIDEIVIF